MTTKTTQSKAAFELELVRLEGGVRSHFPDGLTLTFGGRDLTRGSVSATLWRWIQACRAEDEAEVAYEKALAKRLGIRAEANEFRKVLTALLKRHFGPDSLMLEAFGIAPVVPLAPAAAARLAATRRLRRAVRRLRPLLVAGGWVAAAPLAEEPDDAGEDQTSANILRWVEE